MSAAVVTMSSLLLLLVLLPLLLTSTPASSQLLKTCRFSALYNFGDSLSDTENALVQFPGSTAGRLPYVMTVGKPSGRFSDGLLLIDRIAESAGLPHCNPYLNKTLDHSKGANFAVGGVGLLSKEMRQKLNITFKWSNSSLDEQLGWFHNFSKEAFRSESARKANMESALFVLGGGGNDYRGFHTSDGGGGPEVKKLIIPYLIAALKDGIKALIKQGARRVVAMGVYQGGCMSGFNRTLMMHDQGPIVCDAAWNSYHDQHNKHVQKMVRELANEFPRDDVQVVYGDLWGGVQWMFDHYHSLGLKHSSYRRCCGNETKQDCGEPGTPFCKDPADYIWWDSGHFTDHAYRLIASRVIPEIYNDLECAKLLEGRNNNSSTSSAASTGSSIYRHHLQRLFSTFIISLFFVFV